MKTDLSINGISRSFKVKRFRVTGEPIRHFMTPHNNTGFNSKGSEDMAIKNRQF